MTHHRHTADRGATGPASLARHISVETVEGDTCTADGSTEFTRNTVAVVRDGVIDHYARAGILGGRRLDAATTLAAMYQEGRVAPSGWRCAGVHGGGEMSDARAEAWRDYCRALDHLPKRCEATCADLARGLFPTGLNAVANMLEGFAVLADLWRLPPDK